MELRLMEGLSTAYLRDRQEVKNRSKTMGVRLGLPF